MRRIFESNAERGNEANWDRASDPYYSDGPRGSGVSLDVLNHANGLHFGDGGVKSAGLHTLGIDWSAQSGHSLHADSGEKGGLATNFVAPTDGGTIQDTGPGAGGDTIPGNVSTTVQLVVGAAAQTQWINSATDQDWFQINLTAGHYYEITMDVDATLDGVLSLIAPNGVTVLQTSDGPLGPDTEVVGFYAETDGTYYVKADGFQSTVGQYTISAAEAPLPDVLDSINWGGDSNIVPGTVFGGGASNVIEVYFCAAGESFGGSSASLGWTAYEIQQAMLAFNEYSEVTGCTFVQSFNSGTADFHMVTAQNGGGTLGQMGPPNTGAGSGVGTFWVDGFGWSRSAGGGLEQGGYGFVTLVHEIGHAMGMAHPHDNGGGSSVMLGVTGPFDSYGLYSLNQELFTIMSYNNAWDTGPNGATPGNITAYGFMGTLGAFDIAEMQAKYGANMSFHTGNDIYELPTSNAVGTFFQCIWDAGGDDTIRYSGSANAVINLNAATIDYSPTGGGSPSYASGVYAAFTIAQGVVIERATGGSGNDTITGNDANNTLSGRDGNDTIHGGLGGDILIGGLGADTLDGGSGLDYASYINATAGVGINLTTGIHTGEAAGDTFTNIERYRLSANADTFVGSAATDYAYGAENNDTLSGAGGIDRLYGQDGNDTLNGDAGNDILLGGAGADTFNGGADRDTASYEESTIGLTINLTTGVHTGDATGDTFNSVEILWLSTHDDLFTGSAGDDEVRGNAGIDTLNGSGGSDVLRGEDGNDILNGDDGDDFMNGGAGADAMNGGIGTDTAVYLLATAGVTINLTTGVHGGEALGDTFVSVEHFQLSNGFTLADSFTGSAGDDWVAGYKGVDTINGMAGNDTLNGGDHNDVLNGGADNDKLIGEGGDDSLTGGTGADQFRFTAGLFGHDTITDWENGVDKLRFTGQPGIDNINDLTFTQQGANVLITLPDGSSITVNNSLVGDFDASDFLWI